MWLDAKMLSLILGMERVGTIRTAGGLHCLYNCKTNAEYYLCFSPPFFLQKQKSFGGFIWLVKMWVSVGLL